MKYHQNFLLSVSVLFGLYMFTTPVDSYHGMIVAYLQKV